MYLKTSLIRNSFTQITKTPSKLTLKARGAVINFLATKVHIFPFFSQEISRYATSLDIGLCYSYCRNLHHLLVSFFKPPNLSLPYNSIHFSLFTNITYFGTICSLWYKCNIYHLPRDACTTRCWWLFLFFFVYGLVEEHTFKSGTQDIMIGENEAFCVKRGLNEDHFSSLVLMRTKSSIEDLFERTAYRTGL